MCSFAFLTIIGVLVPIFKRPTCSSCAPSNTIVASLFNPKTNVKPFNQIEIDTLFNVHLVQGDNFNVTVEGGQKARSLVTISSSNSKLSIGTIAGPIMIDTNGKEKVIIQIPKDAASSVNCITLKGCIDFVVDENLIFDVLTLKMQGSGSMLGKYTGNTLNIEHTGHGVINISGSCKQLYCVNSSLGNVDASQLVADDVRVTNTSNGSTSVNCRNNLWATIQAIGNVSYKGAPTIHECQINGIGQLSKILN